MLALDLYRRKTRWQRSARHDVLRTDRASFSIEINEITAPHIDGADAEPHGVRVETIKVDERFKRRLEATGVVNAGGVRRPRRMQPRCRKPRREEPGRAADHRETRVQLVQPLPRGVALEQERV